jgi:uncharacterized protein
MPQVQCPKSDRRHNFGLWTLDFGLYLSNVSRKRKRIAAMVEPHQGHKLDQHYVGFVECFNRGLYYEAHEVLEHIWLPDKHGPNGAFYKGLIQLAGAFVHLQRNRPQPAAALLKLALANLEKYPPRHEHLNLKSVCDLIGRWLADLERTQFKINPLTATNAPQLNLEPDGK